MGYCTIRRCRLDGTPFGEPLLAVTKSETVSRIYSPFEDGADENGFVEVRSTPYRVRMNKGQLEDMLDTINRIREKSEAKE
jgi:hypothetical protein